MKPTLILALMLAAIVGAATWALPIDGTPTSQDGSITVSSVAVGFPATACKVGQVAGGADVPALLQVQTNGIYYRLNSATATPVSTDYIGYADDVLEIARPSLFRAIRSGASDATIKYQCFEK